MNLRLSTLTGLFILGTCAFADVYTATTLQVGGFLDGGLADNDPVHQNYFVGYGTVGGFRSPERRSFFYYHLPSMVGEVVDVSIKLENVVSTSLVFGADPDDGSKHDPMETFQLGATLHSASEVTSMSLTTEEKTAIFDDFNDHPIAAGYDFFMSEHYDFPMVTEIHLDDFGKGLVSSHRGMDLVLTGWMPTWSYDDRMDGSGHFLEGDELIFGHSDVGDKVPFPELTIVTVPEPCSLLGAGLLLLAARRRRKH